jgi:3-oxoacyl-[acyl-carrier protein] reductase
MQLENKVVVITGGGRGIGRAMALAFAQKQAHVALLDLNAEHLEQTRTLCERHGVRARPYLCNVTQEDEVAVTLDRVVTDLGRLDVMVNNAGITKDALLLKVQDGKVVNRMSLAQWQAVMDVNLTGVFLCGREAAAHMVTLGNGGVIINISSISRAGNMGQTNYSAAKAGVVAMTTAWGKELARYQIRTGAIAPGFTRTEILDAMKPEMIERVLAGVPLQRLADPAEIAHAAIFIAENDFFSGRTIEVDGAQRL